MMPQINRRIFGHPYMVVGELELNGGDWTTFLSKVEQHFRIALHLVNNKGWKFDAAMCTTHECDPYYYDKTKHMAVEPGMVRDPASDCVFRYIVVTGVLFNDLTLSEVLDYGTNSETIVRQCFPDRQRDSQERGAASNGEEGLHEGRSTASRLQGQVHEYHQ